MARFELGFEFNVTRFLLGAGAVALIIPAVLALGGKVEAEQNLPWAVLCAGVAIILAYWSVKLAPRGRRRASAGPLATLMCFTAVTVAVVHPVMQGARAVSKSSHCQGTLRSLASGLLMYAADNDEMYPPQGIGDTAPYQKQGGRCESSSAPWTYAMNAALRGKRLTDVAGSQSFVMLFEAEAYGPNAAGGPAWFAKRHGGTGYVALADGSVNPGAGQLRWKP